MEGEGRDSPQAGGNKVDGSGRSGENIEGVETMGGKGLAPS